MPRLSRSFKSYYIVGYLAFPLFISTTILLTGAAVTMSSKIKKRKGQRERKGDTAHR